VIQALGNNLNPAATISAVLDFFPALSKGIVLVLDTGLVSEQDARIGRWIQDVRSEGWAVFVLPTHAQASPVSVRQGLQGLKQSHSFLSHAVLMGRVPVPYSGDIYPDGHTDHRGAWPADGYYADVDGFWTDQQVNSTSGSQARHHNVPGDGKFDPSTFPTDLDLAVGRIDFEDMAAFGTPKILLERYLDKNHFFRTGQWNGPETGIVDDNFPSFQEGFSAPAWRGFWPLFGPQGLQEVDYFGTGNAGGALFGYGCGGGSYQSCSGVGTSSQFVSDSLNIPFNLLFGSYFGDWDNANAFLRAPLASKGLGLVAIWAGRPYVYLNSLAAGANIGDMYRSSANVPAYSFGNAVGQRGVHMALMGDPSLLVFPRKEEAGVQVLLDCDSLRLSWPNVSIAWPEWVELAWASDSVSPAQLLSRQPFGTGQHSLVLPADTGLLFSRLLFKKQTGSGYFYQAGPGHWHAIATQRLSVGLDSIWPETALNACDAGANLSFSGGQAPYQVQWTQIPGGQTGTGTTGLCAGTYVFNATDAAGCTQNSDTVLIPEFNSLGELNAEAYVYPNPTEGMVWVRGLEFEARYSILDVLGREMESGTIFSDEKIDLGYFKSGVYTLVFEGKKVQIIKR
jgi:hypothetical protein